MENVEKWIEESWFQDHKATLTQHGDLQVLDWKEPGTGAYYCRYVFDGSKVYISGDIGEAVFWLTWKASIHSFDDIGIGYFEEKMAAYSEDRRNYDGETAANALLEWKNELLENEVEFDEEEFEGLISAAKNCSSESEWAHTCVNDEYSEFIQELDCDYWEWIYSIGNEIPRRVYGYLVGLQMASKQLKENAVAAK